MFFGNMETVKVDTGDYAADAKQRSNVHLHMFCHGVKVLKSRCFCVFCQSARECLACWKSCVTTSAVLCLRELGVGDKPCIQAVQRVVEETLQMSPLLLTSTFSL